MDKTKVCVWLEPDLYEYLDTARGEELKIPQFIRLILKQKMKSAAKRKPKAITDGSDPFASAIISTNMIPGDLKEYADLIVEWFFSIMNDDFKKKKRTKRKRIYNI